MTIAEIINDKKAKLAEEQILVSPSQMKQQASEAGRIPLDLRDALKKPGLSLIGPVIRASPMTQCSYYKFSATSLSRQELRAGASAIMAATEKTFYQGQESYIGEIREHVNVPVILYDCIIEEYQIYAALTLGADAVVLSAEILDTDLLTRFTTLINSLGMQAVVEIHTEQETETALMSGAGSYMVRNLDLNCSGSIELTRQLAPMIPVGDVLISWGGIRSVEELEQIAGWGADAACPDQKLFAENSRLGSLCAGLKPADKARDSAGLGGSGR